MSKLYGLIPAAGKGTRAYPYTKTIPKCMLDINGTPVLLRNILIMRDKLNISDIFVVLGYNGDYIEDYFGNGHRYGVNLTYIKNDSLEKGFAYSILLAEGYIHDYFCVILSDECYYNSNHEELVSFPYNEAIATCCIMHVDKPNLIRQNYSVSIDSGRVVKLIEKPKLIENDILGCGTFVLNPTIFRFLKEEFDVADSVDFITFIDKLCRKDMTVLPFTLKGKYVNINDRDSLQLAKIYERGNIFDRQTITLLMYSEGNEENIAYAIKKYKSSEFINQIYVILPHDNEIEAIVTGCGIPTIKCPPDIQLYGEKLKYAMENAPGDIFILADAEYSFPKEDLHKLIVFIKEADMVIGNRTTRQMIRQGSEMRGIVRIANIILAKVLELLWWNFECRYSDVNCIFRAVWRNNFYKVRDQLISRGPEFSADMMIEMLKARDRVIEIPVNYSSTENVKYRKYHTFKTFLRIFYLICYKRIQYILSFNKR